MIKLCELLHLDPDMVKNLTCCSITTRAIAAWTTLVLSRQSIQLTLKIPSCLQMTPAWSTLVEEKESSQVAFIGLELLKTLNNKEESWHELWSTSASKPTRPPFKRLIYCYEVKWKIVEELLPGPLHVRDDIRDRIGQYLNILKLHTSADKQDISTKKKQMHCGIKRIVKRYNAAFISPVLVEIKRNISELWVVV